MKIVDGDKTIEIGDHATAMHVDGRRIEGTVESFTVVLAMSSGGRYAASPTEVEVFDPVSELISGWSRENEIRKYAEVHNISIAGALAMLVNSGLSHL